MEDLTISEKEVLLSIKDGKQYPLPLKGTQSTEFPSLYIRHVKAFRMLLDKGLIVKASKTWEFTKRFEHNPNYSFIKRCVDCRTIHNRNVKLCHDCSDKFFETVN